MVWQIGCPVCARRHAVGVSRDTFVVPSWYPVAFEARDETVLFSFSDRPGQEAMGLWREKRG